MVADTTGRVRGLPACGTEFRGSSCSAPGPWLHRGWSLISGLWPWPGEPQVSSHGQGQQLRLSVALGVLEPRGHVTTHNTLYIQPVGATL